GQRQGDSDRVLVPTLLFELVDAAPGIDRVQADAHEVFAHRRHRIDVLVGGDGGPGATVAGTNDEFAGDFADDGRLQQPDRGNGGGQLLVHLLGNGDGAGVVGIRLQRARIDAAEFGHLRL